MLEPDARWFQTMRSLRETVNLQKTPDARIANPPSPAFLIERVRKQSGKPMEQDGIRLTKKPKRSSERGEARAKIIAALNKHHQYADGGCLNLEPIGNNELARLAEVDKSTTSAFFSREFNRGEKEGYRRYRLICRDPSRLAFSLKALNGEFSPHHFYGRLPPDEGEREDE
jgi:hypothetical protein